MAFDVATRVGLRRVLIVLCATEIISWACLPHAFLGSGVAGRNVDRVTMSVVTDVELR